MAHGDWHWHELATPDIDKAKAFYGELFGWSWEVMDMGENGHYHILKQTPDDQGHGGAMQMDCEEWKGIPPHWMTYLEVDDCDAAAKKAKDLGGEIGVEPFDIPGVGRMAVIKDPQGAVFSIMTPTSQG